MKLHVKKGDTVKVIAGDTVIDNDSTEDETTDDTVESDSELE